MIFQTNLTLDRLLEEANENNSKLFPHFLWYGMAAVNATVDLTHTSKLSLVR